MAKYKIKRSSQGQFHENKDYDAYYQEQYAFFDEQEVQQQTRPSLVSRAKRYYEERVEEVKQDYLDQVDRSRSYYGSSNGEMDWYREEQSKRTDRFIKKKLLPAIIIVVVLSLALLGLSRLGN